MNHHVERNGSEKSLSREEIEDFERKRGRERKSEMERLTLPFSDTGHSSSAFVPTSNQRSVCRSLLYGSYSNPTAETGDHLACSSALP